METIMLTGATGFLGSHLLKGLLRETDCGIVVLKRSFSNTFRIDAWLDNNRVKSYNIDHVSLHEVFVKSPVDIIIHSATSYGRDNENVPEIVESNLILPLKLLQSGTEHGLKTFINTDTVIDKRIIHYSLSKSQFLDWLTTYADRVKCLNLRLEHFYGADDNRTKFVSFIVWSLLNNTPSIDLTAGGQKRHFVYVDDVVSAVLCILKNMDSIKGGFSAFDISTEKSITIRDFVLLAKMLSGNTKTQLNFGVLPYRDGELMDIQTDIRTLKALGWQPKVSLEKGLAMMIAKEGKEIL